MQKIILFKVLTLILFFSCSTPLLAQNSTGSKSTAVDIVVVLAVDVSGSVDEVEYQLQKKGIIFALKSDAVQSILNSCNSQGIALSYVEWSGEATGQRTVKEVVPWTHIKKAADFNAFGDRMQIEPRSSDGETDIVQALQFSMDLLEESPFTSFRKAILLSGDGQQSVFRTIPGLMMPAMHSELEMTKNRIVNNKQIVISAIAITDTANQKSDRGQDDKTLQNYFLKHVKGGPGSFVLSVDSFEAYAEAVKEQILRALSSGCVS